MPKSKSLSLQEMLRQVSCRRSNSRTRKGAMTRLLWIVGYLTVTLGALLSTYVFPEMLHSLRAASSEIQSPDIIVLPKGDLGGQTVGWSWKQELHPPHVRSTKITVRSHQEGFEKKLWTPPADGGFVPCVKPNPKYIGVRPSKGYLLVSSNGGLNQMRAGICDMVAVARLINATLVIPELDKSSFWQDSSNFSDIFDMDHFMKSLANDIPIIKKLPKSLKGAPKVIKQFRSWSSVKYYEEDIGRLWQNYKVIKAAKSDSRLANNNLPQEIQKLRCRVHYDALRFAPHIEALGKVLVERMRAAGPYIALHLRYEKDMLAFSGCTYGLSKKEARDLTTIRENTSHWRIKKINATEQRSKGLCPLTPKEVGVFLRALGYPETTRIYIAAGEIYGGHKRMSDLLSRFPYLLSKETIATDEELAPFVKHSSQMAALDYIVSVESDVFVPSYSGNMARAVEGHRRFLGHRKTINPDRKELVALFDLLDKNVFKEDQELAALITALHSNRHGAPRKRKGPMKGTRGRDRFRSEEAFYTNPNPDCLCRQPILSDDSKNIQSYSPLHSNVETLKLVSGAALERR